MEPTDRLAIIRDKLVALASEVRGLKSDADGNAYDSLEAGEDAIDEAVTCMRDAIADLHAARS